MRTSSDEYPPFAAKFVISRGIFYYTVVLKLRSVALNMHNQINIASIMTFLSFSDLVLLVKY